MKKLEFKNIQYRGWKNSCYISNDIIEIIIPTAIGPRISSLSLKGKTNIMYEEHDIDDKKKFHIYGGHRLWHGPQVGDRPEEPDNSAIKLEKTDDGVILTQPTEKESRIEKKMIVHIEDNHVRIEYFLTNHNVWDIECTVWGITSLSPGGVGILPLSKRDTNNLPNQALMLWPWSKINDSRVHYCDDYLAITQDVNNKDWWKMGFSNDRGWMAYAKDEQLFVTRFSMDISKKYSDYGASCESFTSEYFFELETVSPLYKVAAGETVSLEETWSIYKSEPIIVEKDIDKIVKKIEDNIY